jgi:cobalt-zinc-cadmium efflux system outer membrane protein
LERAAGVPDLTVGAGVRHARGAGETSVLFELGLPLPLFDRRSDAARAADRRVRQGEEARRSERARLSLQLTLAHESLAEAEAEARALRERVIPQAETAFGSAREAFLRGSMRFADVLDTERLLFEIEHQYFDALGRYHAAVADVEALIGEPLRGDRSGRP